jgi:hypothetical protein
MLVYPYIHVKTHLLVRLTDDTIHMSNLYLSLILIDDTIYIDMSVS